MTATSLDRVRSSRTVYTWINCAAYNRDAEGDYGNLYLTAAARDTALRDVRAVAVRRGLSESAARSGIYAVKMTAAEFLRDRRNRDTLPEAFSVEG